MKSGNLGYKPGTIAQNRQGNLTSSQKLKLYSSTVVSIVLFVGFGGLIAYVGVAAFASGERQNLLMFLFCEVFGFGLIAAGVQKVYAHYQDRQLGVKTCQGVLSVTASQKEGRYDIRSYRLGSKKYKLRVTPQHRNSETLVFEVERDFLDRIRNGNPAQIYRVYYFEKSKTILSIESENQQ